MDALYWLVPLALLWPMLWVLRLAMVTRMLLGLRFTRDRFRPLAAAEVPAHEAEAAAPLLGELAGLGFGVRQIWRRESERGPAFEYIEHELAHAREPVRAHVRVQERIERLGECQCALLTTLADGRELVTASLVERLPLPLPAAVLFESVALPPAGLLARHRERLARLQAEGGMPVMPDATAAVAREEETLGLMLEALRSEGLATTEADGGMRLRIRPALGIARRAVAEELARQRAQKGKAATATPPPLIGEAARREFEWEAYRRLRAIQQGRMSWVAKTALMVGSLVLFALALGWTVSPSIAAVLLGALVVHECGHLVGMWIFGYKDTQLLFLPFLGGAAIGHDEPVLAPWKHLVILFLGPLPGLLAGLAVFLPGFEPGALLREAGLVLVFFNAFNLLPMLPLDGGQIVDVAFASRFPRLRVAFIVVSGLALVLAGLQLHGTILLMVLGGFQLLRVRDEWRRAALVQELRAAGDLGTDEEPVVRRLLVRLQEAPWQKLAPVQRLQTARSLQRTVRQPRPGVGTVLFALAGYTSPLWLLLPVLVALALTKRSSDVDAAWARAEAAGLRQRAIAAPAGAPAVSPADNAAVPFEEALALHARRVEEQLGEASAAPSLLPSEEPVVAQILALLHDAAGRPRFAPAATEEEGYERSLRRSGPLELLAAEARARLRLRQPGEALVLALDGLRVRQRLQTAPAWWSWSAEFATQTALWTIVEESLADGASVPAATLAELAALANEEELIAFARVAMPAERLRLAAYMAAMMKNAGAAAGEQPAWLRVLAFLGRFGAVHERAQADMVDSAVELRSTLDAAARGEWRGSKLGVASDEIGEDDGEGGWSGIDDVAALVGRLRQARAALAIGWQERTTGLRPKGFGEVAAPWWQTTPVQPLSGVALTWRRVGAAEVLEFELPDGDETIGGLGVETSWRLPAER